METALVNSEEITTKAQRSEEKMKWDTTTIDKLLYLVNSIVLLVCGVVLMFIIKPLDAPLKSIRCWTPAEYSASWTQYTEKYCLSAEAKLYEKRKDIDDDASDPFSNETVNLNEFYPVREANSDFSTVLFFMAILSLLPFLCWRLVGFIDGRDFLTKGGTSTRNGFIVMLWFLITKVGTAALCAYFVLLTIGMNDQGRQYLDASEHNGQPEDRTVLCAYQITRLGRTSYNSKVQCVISKGQYDVSSLFGQFLSFEHILDSMLKSLQIWLITLLAVNAINLLATAIFLLSLSSKSSRINFIQRYVPDGADMATCDKIDRKLGFTGAIVFNLAVRQGHGEQVKNALTELCVHQN